MMQPKNYQVVVQHVTPQITVSAAINDQGRVEAAQLIKNNVEIYDIRPFAFELMTKGKAI